MRLFIFIAALASCSVARAQAFGVEPGASVSQYRGKPESAPGFYMITVPQPNSEFEGYEAIATPQTGICAIQALGVTHRNDNYGTSTKAAFAGLRSALNRKYGRSKDFDFLKSGAVWDGPGEWVWSIYKEERVLDSFWTAENGSSLPAGIDSIWLGTKAVDSSGPYLKLKYEFANYIKCKAILDQAKSQGL